MGGTQAPNAGAKRAPQAGVTTRDGRSFSVQYVPVARIRPEDGLGRKRDRDGHRELQQSIAQFGVLTPITVRLAPVQASAYRPLRQSGVADQCGHRRECARAVRPGVVGQADEDELARAGRLAASVGRDGARLSAQEIASTLTGRRL